VGINQLVPPAPFWRRSASCHRSSSLFPLLPPPRCGARPGYIILPCPSAAPGRGLWGRAFERAAGDPRRAEDSARQNLS